MSLNNAAGASLLGTLNLTHILTSTAGTFNTGGFLTLVSTQNYTAQVAPVFGSIIGTTTVERYLPGKRAWRFLTAPLNSNGLSAATVNNTWQNQCYVVGMGGVGLDATNFHYSLQTFASNNWVNVTNTLTETLFNSPASAANKAFATFIPGTRIIANQTAPNYNDVTLSATGNLQTGTQTFSNIVAAAGDNTFIGNPYASPIDLDKMYLNAGTNNINRTFYTWDPRVGGALGTGSYITISWNGADYDIVPNDTTTQTQMIQSGQAFFVEATAAGTSTIIFQENNKNTINNTTVFGVQNNNTDKLFINLRKQVAGNWIAKDGVLASFNSTYNKTVMVNEDANKYFNNEEIIAINRNDNLLSIERRPYIANDDDSLFLSMYNLTPNAAYSFQFKPQNWDAIQQAFLIDKLLNTQKAINLFAINTLQFTPTTATLNNRFIIVFKGNGTLAIGNQIKLSAQVHNNNANINWIINNEQGIATYSIEKSNDGITFKTPAVQNVEGKTNYKYVDKNVVDGVIYYRIKMTMKNGEFDYSNTITLNIKLETTNLITVFPNPVKGNVVNLQTNRLVNGKYYAKLFNNIGKLIEQTSFNSVGNDVITLKFNSLLGSQNGSCTLLINGQSYTQAIKLIVTNNQ